MCVFGYVYTGSPWLGMVQFVAVYSSALHACKPTILVPPSRQPKQVRSGDVASRKALIGSQVSG